METTNDFSDNIVMIAGADRAIKGAVDRDKKFGR